MTPITTKRGITTRIGEVLVSKIVVARVPVAGLQPLVIQKPMNPATMSDSPTCILRNMRMKKMAAPMTPLAHKGRLLIPSPPCLRGRRA